MNKYEKYDDNELLHCMSASDGEAFSEIYRRYWKVLFSIAFNRLKITQLAEDVVHDVFASLWKNRQDASIHSLNSYLASATRYLVFATIKKNTRVQHYTEVDTQVVAEGDMQEALHNKLLLEFIHREVEVLPQKCRLIFKQSREKGMTTKEIATELQIATKTVENQINKALHHLRFSMRKMLQVFF